MSNEKKQEKLSGVYVELPSKKAIGKLVLEGEIADVCNPEQARAEMQAVKEADGHVLIYKRKKAVKAIAVFAVEEREIPLNAALVDKKDVLNDVLKEDKNREVEADETAETVKKNCYVLKSFYLVPSYEANREDMKQLFGRIMMSRVYESGNKIPAYVWEDELVMANQMISDGKMVSTASIGSCLGGAIGLLIGIISDSGNPAMGFLWGMIIGGALAAGTTSMKSNIMFIK